MPYGLFNPAMQRLVQPIIQGKTVFDFGAGDLHHTQTLVALGATSVVAIDKLPVPKKMPKGCTYIQSYFRDIPDTHIDVAFVAWPQNYDMGLGRLLAKSEVVIYLGKNTDGSACGDKKLFQGLISRNLLAVESARENTMIVYGSKQVERALVQEELAVFSSDLLFYSA